MEMECANETKKLRDKIEKEKIFYFLVGLNLKFDDVSGRVLSKVLLSINEVFAYVRGGRRMQRYNA